MANKEASLRIHESRADKTFNWIIIGFTAICMLLCVYPLYFVIIASFSDPSLVALGEVILIPKGLTFEGYAKILVDKELWTGYRNTILYTGLGTTLNLCLTLTAGFALSRRELPFRKAIMALFTITMFINGGLVPTYLLIRNLGLYNSFWVMVLLNGISVYNMIICRTFFESTIPGDLWDAVQVDGCTEFRYFWQIVLPLSGAVIAVLALYYAVGHWNSYFNAMIYLRDKSLYSLQLVLRNILIANQYTDDMASLDVGADTSMKLQTMKYAIIVVSTVPMLIIYPFVQKHFVKGVMIGAVKG